MLPFNLEPLGVTDRLTGFARFEARLPCHLPKLLNCVRQALRRKHYSYRTEEAYLNWIKRYILFHDKRHPEEMDAPEIEAFLTHVAMKENAPIVIARSGATAV